MKTALIAIPVIVAVIAAGIFISLGIEKPQPESSNDNSEISTILNEQDNKTKVQKNDSDERLMIETDGNSTKLLSPDQILNKDVPPNYEFGNSFINRLESGPTYSEITNNDQKGSIRFTNQYDGYVNKIDLHLFSNNETQAIIGIQLDDDMGNPDGNWLNNFTSESVPIMKGKKSVFALDGSVFLEKDKVYHIIVQSPLSTSVDSSKSDLDGDIEPIIIFQYRDNPGAYPFNPKDPDIFLPDSALDSLHFDGNSWKALNSWPSFVIYYSDGHTEGQPYTLAAPWVVHDGTYVGQTIIPYSNYDVSKFFFVVSTKGDPTEPLYYGIQDHSGLILRSGLFATHDQVEWVQKLVEIDLEEPIKLEAGQLYRFYVYTTAEAENNNNIYRIYGQEFTFDPHLSYGGLVHRLTISHDHGKTWSAWYDADALFKLTTK